MKNIITVGIVSSLFALSLSANSDLEKKIDSLQKQITELKTEQIKIKTSQENNSDDLEDRIDGIETATLTDKIKFGLEFRTRVDTFQQKTAAGDKSTDSNLWSNRLRLNMNSKVNDDFKFVGRLTMYKNWSDSNINVFSNQDSMQGRRPSNSSLYVERAYVNWTVARGKIPLILTIGRQPSSDGPSYQFKNNTVRKSTYSALSFDGATDGIVATMPLNKLTGIDGMALRLGYGKGYQNSSNQSYIGNPTGIADTNVYGVFLDSGLGIDGSLFQISAVKAMDVASMTRDTAGVSTNKTIGDISLYTLMMEFTNIKDSGLDLFAHYAISQSNPNGVVTNQNFGGKDYPVGLLTNRAGDTATKSGNAYWIGGRYTLPVTALHNPKIGLEYNHGDKNWFSFTQGSNDVTNKLATRGSAIEGYYIQPINRYAYLRTGVTYIKNDYTGSGYQIGAPADIATQGTNLKDLTNFYLLFNLAY